MRLFFVNIVKNKYYFYCSPMKYFGCLSILPSDPLFSPICPPPRRSSAKEIRFSVAEVGVRRTPLNSYNLGVEFRCRGRSSAASRPVTAAAENHPLGCKNLGGTPNI